MKIKTKRISIAGLSAICALSVVAGASLLAVNNAKPAFADTNAAPSPKYYYDNLTDAEGKEYTLAKEFYAALDEMNENGDFKDGVVQYDIKDIVSSAEIAGWVSGGDLTVPKAFSAARDSYYYDHPELFYIDIYKLSLSAGRIGGNYVAYIDCGREANLYAEGGFTSESQVNKAIAAYNAKINEVAEYAEAEAQKDNCGIAKEVLLARYANSYIAQHTTYDDKSLNDLIQNSSSVTTGSVSQTAYGALVAETAVCNGYSRAFKAVMDKLEIPCIVVGGYSVAKNSQGEDAKTNSNGKLDNLGEPHAWNYVWYVNPVIKEEIDEDEVQPATYAEGQGEGSWYSYDVTWNSTTPHTTLAYCDMGVLSDGKCHSADGEVSTSGYLLPYPELSTFNYGCANATNGLSRVGVYSATDSGGITYDDYGNPRKQLTEYISYNGKGADKLLEEDGLYIIYRYQGYENGTDGNLTWTPWYSVSNAWKTVGMGDENPYQSMLYAFYDGLYSQFAVTDLEPDGPDDNQLKWVYGDEELLAEHIIDITGLYENKTYGTYLSAPHVASTNPVYTEKLEINDGMVKSGTSMMDEKYAFTLSVTYNEPLHKLKPNEPIGVTYVTKYPISNLSQYTKFVPVDRKKYGEDVVVLSEDGKTLTFRFMPSLMYEHNEMLYSFQFTNVGSAKTMYKKNGEPYTTNKLPNSAPYSFGRYLKFCTQKLGGGRLWLECCAQPTLVSDSNLAEMQFKDENGSLFTTNASQMMLVVESVSEETENAMLKAIDKDLGVSSEEIKKSETYDIDLQHCGKYSTIADGSHVRISLGFPEGYGPEDEGVVFKIYHRKHIQGNEYIIEEIPCVVTKLGIVATVKSFSPYMVAAVDANSVPSYYKTIVASIDGKGGKLSLEDAEIKSLSKGQGCSYTIKPDEGYEIYSVTLNGKDVTEKVQNDKLDLTFDELLNNNELEIKYISEAAKQRFAAKAVEMVDPVKVVVAVNGTTSIATPADQLPINKIEISDLPVANHTTLIIVCVVIAVVVVCGTAVACCLILRNRLPVKQTAGGKAKTKEKAKAQKAKPATSSAPKTSGTATRPVASTATAAAPKTSGIAGSAANKPTATAAAPKTSGIAGSAANKPAATASAPWDKGIAGSAATKPAAPAAKPATSSAPKTSVAAGSAATKPATTAAKPAAAPANTATPKTSGIAGSAATKPGTKPTGKK